MTFKWEQKPTEKGQEMQYWVLVDKDSGKVVLQIALSYHATQQQNCKIRNKIQKIYEVYFSIVYFQNFKFFNK